MKKVKRFAEFVETRDIPQPSEMIPVDAIEYSLPDLPEETTTESLQQTTDENQKRKPT